MLNTKYKNIPARRYVPNWSEETWSLGLKNLKILCHGHMLLLTLTLKKLLESFTKKCCKKQIKKSLELKKVIKRKDDKLYIEWKGYDSSFNSCIDKKDIM